jgi:hypothetical protein
LINETPTNDADHPEQAALLAQSFDAVWAAIETRNPDRDREGDIERQAALSQILAGLVVDGVTDPQQLVALALEQVSPVP